MLIIKKYVEYHPSLSIAEAMLASPTYRTSGCRICTTQLDLLLIYSLLSRGIHPRKGFNSSTFFFINATLVLCFGINNNGPYTLRRI